MTPTTQATPSAVPSDVLAFAETQGVTAELPAVLAMTRHLFPRASLSLSLDEDPEIPNDRHIVVGVKRPGLSADDAVAVTWQWHRELFGCCPAPLVCVFRLGLEGLE